MLRSCLSSLPSSVVACGYFVGQAEIDPLIKSRRRIASPRRQGPCPTAACKRDDYTKDLGSAKRCSDAPRPTRCANAAGQSFGGRQQIIGPLSQFALQHLCYQRRMRWTWRGHKKGETARRIVLYGLAYKLAWEQIPPDQKHARPDISLRIHASIRRQLKEGAKNPNGIAFAALKDALLPDTH